jgi:sirohydrochlorin cobaltochelatase
MTPSTPAGIVLFAHGSRDPLWRQPMDAVAHRIRQIDPGAVVACAFLELTTPDLPTAVHDLVTQGARRITIVPMFLGVGRHAREDLPVLMADLRARHADIDFALQRSVGEDERLTDLLAQISLG